MFGSTSEEIRSAASYALGIESSSTRSPCHCMCVCVQGVFVPVTWKPIYLSYSPRSNQHPRNSTSCCTRSRRSSPVMVQRKVAMPPSLHLCRRYGIPTLAILVYVVDCPPNSRDVLFLHFQTLEEGTRNVVAECVGKLILVEPAKLLPLLRVCGCVLWMWFVDHFRMCVHRLTWSLS